MFIFLEQRSDLAINLINSYKYQYLIRYTVFYLLRYINRIRGNNKHYYLVMLHNDNVAKFSHEHTNAS